MKDNTGYLIFCALVFIGITLCMLTDSVDKVADNLNRLQQTVQR